VRHKASVMQVHFNIKVSIINRRLVTLDDLLTWQLAQAHPVRLWSMAHTFRHFC